MNIRVITGTILETNNYLIENEGKFFIIDCSASIENFEYFIQNKNVEAILLTHGHWDHFLTLEKTAKKYGATIITSKLSLENMGERMHFTGDKPVYFSTENLKLKYVEDNETFTLCGVKIKALTTPGHTNCSVSYLIGNKLFSGDTLFADGIGRTDLPTGSLSSLKTSLNKLFSLPPQTEVFPGHGPSTTIKYESMNFKNF